MKRYLREAIGNLLTLNSPPSPPLIPEFIIYRYLQDSHRLGKTFGGFFKHNFASKIMFLVKIHGRFQRLIYIIF